MKYEEIAELFGLRTGAVKVRVHRALKNYAEIFMKLSSENHHACEEVREHLRIM